MLETLQKDRWTPPRHPDILVAAHAAVRADRLLTHERSFARASLTKLEILDPSASSKS